MPGSFWQSLFITGHGFWSSLQNVVLGPFLAIISFVCSIGNVPLAAALWHGGSSFGGVVSFVFADLITLPLLGIYRKYFGGRITLRLLARHLGGHERRRAGGRVPVQGVHIAEPARPEVVARTGFEWNYTTILNLIALVGFAVIYWLYRTRDPRRGEPVREGPDLRHAGGEGQRGCHGRARRRALLVLLRRLPRCLLERNHRRFRPKHEGVMSSLITTTPSTRCGWPTLRTGSRPRKTPPG